MVVYLVGKRVILMAFARVGRTVNLAEGLEAESAEALLLRLYGQDPFLATSGRQVFDGMESDRWYRSRYFGV